jgi:hypothetical protein
LSRRRFLATAVAGTAGTALALPDFARRALAQTPACDYLAENWSAKVKAKLASRLHRLHHVLWHALRNNWAGLEPAQRRSIEVLGWAPPRPALEKPAWDLGRLTRAHWTIGLPGEDFLYFHRWLIALTDRWLIEEGRRPLESWSRLDTIPAPAAGCTDEKVPDFVPDFGSGAPEFLKIRVREVKSDAFFWNRMAWWDSQFKDQAALRAMTLGELGARIELSVHNQMHIRWSAYPANGKKVRPEEDIDPKWDDPGYDTLFDEYASHVHPIFFRLHKWIDNRIDDWALANADRVERVDSGRGFAWYRDKDGGRRLVQVAEPWSGAFGLEHPEAHGPDDPRIETMERIHRILFKLPEPGQPRLEAAAAPVDLLMLKDLF